MAEIFIFYTHQSMS